jgi:hypothetical protein
MIEIPPEGYLIRCKDQLQLDPITLNRTIRPARDRGLSVITVHTHPGSTQPWFSDADDRGDARLMPSLFHQMAGPHGWISNMRGSRMRMQPDTARPGLNGITDCGETEEVAI